MFIIVNNKIGDSMQIGNSVLMVAARAGHRDLVSTLLKRGVNFTEANKVTISSFSIFANMYDVHAVCFYLNSSARLRCLLHALGETWTLFALY